MTTDRRGGDAPLRRALNLPMLTLFGLGTMIGAGIYVLVGEILDVAGAAAPWAFALAAVVAAFTAISYGELAARYPLSGGEAVYVERAFSLPPLSALVGWSVVATGLVSCATLANGFAGYMTVFAPELAPYSASAFVVILGGVAIWGIRQTMWLAAAVTVASVVGLLAVLGASGRFFARLPELWPVLLPSPSTDYLAVIGAAFIAFYAFVGFEDMVNVAEETSRPDHAMPRAILLALLIAAVLYILVATAAVLASFELPVAGHPAPLAAMVAGEGRHWTLVIAGLSLLSVTNSALAQIVMASRVMYGLAGQGQAPSLLGRVHPQSRTPVVASATVTFVVLALAWWFPLLTLAKATSLVILLVFTVVNVALLRLKLSGEVPRRRLWVPLTGAVLAFSLVSLSLF